MKLVFDIEANGLLDDLDTIHSLVTYDPVSKELSSFANHGSYPEIRKGLDLLSKADTLIGHNIICYDLPALKKVYNFKTDAYIFDTLNASRLIWPELNGHSLADWGERLNFPKGEHSDWLSWSREMQSYCEQDVKVNTQLYHKIETKNCSQRALDIEFEFQKIIHKQEVAGVPFNKTQACELADIVGRETEESRNRITSSIKNVIKRGKVFTPKRKNVSMGYYEGASFTRISIEQFNPNSSNQIVETLKRKYGWEPVDYTDKGNPKTGDEVLRALPWEEAQLIADYKERFKILGYLKTGKANWIDACKNGRIHGKVITNGTVTGRCSHSKPNLAQVPSTRSYMGYECRSLFHAGAGWLVGADASSLELRLLAHYLAAYDGGEYAREILTGDIHTKNQRAANLETRDNAKTFIYAFIYGAGDAKLGSIKATHADNETKRKVGTDMRYQFYSRVPGIQQLINDVKLASKRGYIKALDGRHIPIRSNHLALNALLQSAGAIVMKQAAINFEHDYDFPDTYYALNVHDEMQLITNREDLTEDIGKAMVKSIIKAGEQFNLRCPLDGEYKIGKNWAETH